jgi:hypothetical protein
MPNMGQLSRVVRAETSQTNANDYARALSMLWITESLSEHFDKTYLNRKKCTFYKRYV